MTTCVNFER